MGKAADTIVAVSMVLSPVKMPVPCPAWKLPIMDDKSSLFIKNFGGRGSCAPL